MPAGRPKGSLNDKPWKEAIRRAVNKRAVDGGKALDRLAMSLVQKGYEGDVAALKEVGDRLDGKATQALEHSGPDGAAIPVQFIELRAVRPNDPAD